MPTASKRGKINKARPLGRARLMTRKKETINGEGTNAPLSVQRLVNAIAIDDRNNPSCVSTSATPPPPPPDVCSSDLRHRCRHRDGDFIVGNSNIPGGEEGKEKTLLRTTHGIHRPLPIVLPPRVLIPRYSTGDYVRCRKEDNATSPPFPRRTMSP